MSKFSIKRALISVFNKDVGVLRLAEILSKNNVEIFSSGGTYEYLKEYGYNPNSVENFTGFSKLLGGRVKTLHPEIFSRILATDKDNIDGVFQLVAVDLYPFEDVLSKNKPVEELVEMIDIGGVALLRASAKNHKFVLTLCGVDSFTGASTYLDRNHCEVDETYSRNMAKYSFNYTSYYDSLISKGLFGDDYTEDFPTFPEYMTVPYKLQQTLRYGENPHQRASFYKEMLPSFAGNFKQLQGKELSYNNLLDLDGAVFSLSHFKDENTCVILKHTSPCGIASDENPATAFTNALASDPLSAFGGIIGFNCNVTKETAEKITEIFSEVIIAPSYDDDALTVFEKKKNLRVLISSETDINSKISLPEFMYRGICGGMLVSDYDKNNLKNIEELLKLPKYKIVSNRMPSDLELAQLLFAWRSVKCVKSNAIVITKGKQTLGIGGGLPSRVDAAKLAVVKAGDKAENAVAASDAFMPFPDALEQLAAAGVKCLIQPGGSRNDPLSIDAANKLDISLVFTGMRHFRH